MLASQTEANRTLLSKASPEALDWSRIALNPERRGRYEFCIWTSNRRWSSTASLTVALSQS